MMSRVRLKAVVRRKALAVPVRSCRPHGLIYNMPVRPSRCIAPCWSVGERDARHPGGRGSTEAPVLADAQVLPVAGGGASRALQGGVSGQQGRHRELAEGGSARSLLCSFCGAAPAAFLTACSLPVLEWLCSWVGQLYKAPA